MTTASGAPPTDSSTDEATLVARIAARDEDAFREAIEVHASVLHRIAWRMVGEASEAEDIAQEAMLKLWDNAVRLNTGQPINLGAWLRRVATNLAIDRLRVAKRQTLGEVPEGTDQAPLADAQIEASEQGDTARMLLSSLAENQRAAIVLTYYEELPNAEAARALDMNIKAFESLLHRARGSLRKAYAALGKQGGIA